MLNTSPPHNLEAENQLLGALLYEEANLQMVKGKLYPNDFYTEAHQKIFQGILDLDETGERIDHLTINEILKQQGLLNKVGGPAYISGLTDNLISSSNIESALKLIKEASHKRWLLNTARKFEQDCFNGGDPSEIVSTFQKKIDLIKREISYEDSEKPLPTAGLIIKQLKTEINQNKGRGFLGINPGFEFLKKSIKAFIPGHLWIVGGYTSHGKSAFAVELMSRVLSNAFGVHVVLFSTEMSAETYLLRLIANQTGIPSFVILQGDHLPEIKQRIDEAFEFISKKNLIIFDDFYRFKEIAGKARSIKAQTGLDLLFIDFIQNIKVEGSSIYERMSILAPELQALAKELSCTVVAMSQVSNEAVKDNSGLIGFKGAGEIAAAADLGLWLERERDSREGFKVNGEVLNVFIRKNRHGATGKSTLKFCGNFTRLEEVN